MAKRFFEMLDECRAQGRKSRDSRVTEGRLVVPQIQPSGKANPAVTSEPQTVEKRGEAFGATREKIATLRHVKWSLADVREATCRGCQRPSQVVPGEMAAQGDVVQFALLVALLVGLKRGLLLFAQSFERAHFTIGRDQCLALGIDLPGKLDALLLALCSLGSQHRRVTLEFEATARYARRWIVRQLPGPGSAARRRSRSRDARGPGRAQISSASHAGRHRALPGAIARAFPVERRISPCGFRVADHSVVTRFQRFECTMLRTTDLAGFGLSVCHEESQLRAGRLLAGRGVLEGLLPFECLPPQAYERSRASADVHVRRSSRAGIC